MLGLFPCEQLGFAVVVKAQRDHHERCDPADTGLDADGEGLETCCEEGVLGWVKRAVGVLEIGKGLTPVDSDWITSRWITSRWIGVYLLHVSCEKHSRRYRGRAQTQRL